MLGILFIFIASALWALDTLIRYPLLSEGISAEKIVFFEHLILASFFIPTLYKQRMKIWNAKVSHIFYFVVVGGLGSALGTLCFTRAFGLINPTLVILLQKLQPVIAIIFARIVLKEPIYKKFIYWAVLCLLGGLLVSHQQLFPGLKNLEFGPNLLNEKYLLGYVLTLVAVFGWGAGTVFGKKLSLEGYDEKEIMTGRFCIGLVAMIPVFFTGKISFDANFPVYTKILVMCLISGLLAMYIYYKGLKKISARVCALAELAFPFCAVTINWVFLGASLDAIQIAGGVLLVIGSTVIQVKQY